MRESAPAVWAVIPAAGVGRRMAGAIPKQYLPLVGRTVIEWSIDAVIDGASPASVIVALAPDDARFSALAIAAHPLVRVTAGGAERAASVLNALTALSQQARDEDWVLVHDAVRPCVQAEDVRRLLAQIGADAVGGLLAAPVNDTLKSADADGRVLATVPRAGLWRALTPQVFRLGLLRRALQAAAQGGQLATDESSAIEALGLRPKLIAGRADNIKITVPEDVAIAERILHTRTDH